MDETIRQANIDLQAENRNLHTLNTSLHEKYHTMSLKVLLNTFPMLCLITVYHKVTKYNFLIFSDVRITRSSHW